ncbi:hypothetical protein Ddye_014055 [Dipteronia dyeriana]|uniref:Uncharacterized protein n=1 Tax=Dipteronia dyeriana TaxID=168575 RepID=A0AAD9X7G1_9ROSI|nr:hypothetical protein Ddye_014055 [Dipteronia dyeriana]
MLLLLHSTMEHFSAHFMNFFFIYIFNLLSISSSQFLHSLFFLLVSSLVQSSPIRLKLERVTDVLPIVLPIVGSVLRVLQFFKSFLLSVSACLGFILHDYNSLRKHGEFSRSGCWFFVQ